MNDVILENKLNITDSVKLAYEEERISKKKAVQLFENGLLHTLKAGTVESLLKIHEYLFQEIYVFAGKLREIDLSRGNFRFVSVMYLQEALNMIEKMPQFTFDEIVQKYVEMNIAHPFWDGKHSIGQMNIKSKYQAKIKTKELDIFLFQIFLKI